MEIEIMAKRFTATEKWTDPWFCGLSDNNKLFWLYLLDNCDNAGIWRVNWFIFGCYVKNYTYNPELFKSRIIILDDEKWFIPKFVEFQYGRLNPACVPHLSVIKLLEKHTLTQEYLKGWLTLKDKDKDKDMDKEKGKEVRNKVEKIRFSIPNIEQVREYCCERKNKVNPEKWMAYYEARGWKLKTGTMVDWKAAVRTWEHSQFEDTNPKPTPKAPVQNKTGIIYY